jgi:hypothetical protein
MKSQVCNIAVLAALATILVPGAVASNCDWTGCPVDAAAATTAPPTGLTFGHTSGGIALAWTAPTVPAGLTLSGYNVYRSPGTGGVFAIQNTSPVPAGTTTFTDSGAVTGTTYAYYVTAVYNAGESAGSAPVVTFSTCQIIWMNPIGTIPPFTIVPDCI